MKKLLLLITIALSTAMQLHAQASKLTAVLTHEGTNTTFHGGKALQEANEAAVDGDIITLSGGTFQPITISKSLTIRGAGMFRTDSTDIDRTLITSGTTIADSTCNLSLENMWISGLTTGKALVNVNFFKVGTGTLDVHEGSDICLINCRVYNTLHCEAGGKVIAFNSFILRPNVTSDESLASYYNCVLSYHSEQGSHGHVYPSEQRYTYYENCIIYSGWVYDFPQTVTAKNNLGLYQTVFYNITNNTNTTIFEDYTTIVDMNAGGNAEDSRTYRLLGDAATKYLGSDGTQVGMYGGLYPYDAMPHHPIITQVDVAPRDDNGKLKVMIEVSGDE